MTDKKTSKASKVESAKKNVEAKDKALKEAAAAQATAHNELMQAQKDLLAAEDEPEDEK